MRLDATRRKIADDTSVRPQTLSLLQKGKGHWSLHADETSLGWPTVTGRQIAAIAALVVAAIAAPRLATAEEGLFITRVSGGVSTVHPEMPDIGQAWNASMDLTISERTGIIGSTHLVLHDVASTLGLGLGIKRLLVERFWKRLYVHLSPELVFVWPDGEARRWDIAVRAGIGYEQLFMWGFGFVIEVDGSAPAGRGDAEPLDAASAELTVGLFMEF